MMDETKLLQRITINPKIFSGKPIIRDRRLAVEHVLGMLAAGDTPKLYWRATHGWSRRTFRLAWCMRAEWSAMSV